MLLAEDAARLCGFCCQVAGPSPQCASSCCSEVILASNAWKAIASRASGPPQSVSQSGRLEPWSQSLHPLSPLETNAKSMRAFLVACLVARVQGWGEANAAIGTVWSQHVEDTQHGHKSVVVCVTKHPARWFLVQMHVLVLHILSEPLPQLAHVSGGWWSITTRLWVARLDQLLCAKCGHELGVRRARLDTNHTKTQMKVQSRCRLRAKRWRADRTRFGKPWPSKVARICRFGGVSNSECGPPSRSCPERVFREAPRTSSSRGGF